MLDLPDALFIQGYFKQTAHPLSAKERVLERFPGAYLAGIYEVYWIEVMNVELSDTQFNAESAWEDAAQRIEAAHPTEEK